MRNFSVLFIFSCAILSTSFAPPPKVKINFYQKQTIYIQPLGEVSPEYLSYTQKAIENFYGYDVVIKPTLPLTTDILANSGVRYEASKILDKYDSDKITVIITCVDIAHYKNEKSPEWGVFGLGKLGGKVCVVSTFRLTGKLKILPQKTEKKNLLIRLEKVVLHEIGHNLGLEHCTNNKECMMNDANGTIKQLDSEKIWFCPKCAKFTTKIKPPQ